MTLRADPSATMPTPEQIARTEGYRDGFKDGVKRARDENKSNSLWVPVIERRPVNGVPCLCAVKLSDGTLGVVAEVMRHKHGVWVYGVGDEDYPYPTELTHWMPLPEAPEHSKPRLSGADMGFDRETMEDIMDSGEEALRRTPHSRRTS